MRRPDCYLFIRIRSEIGRKEEKMNYYLDCLDKELSLYGVDFKKKKIFFPPAVSTNDLMLLCHSLTKEISSKKIYLLPAGDESVRSKKRKIRLFKS